MIKNIPFIRNMAVFEDFKWNACVVDEMGRPQSFKQINVLYGQNYSGKTTLSRIVRALETGSVSKKYGAPEFGLALQDGTMITQTSLPLGSRVVRVFNEDFVRENLRCIYNPDDSIEPFVITVGTDNQGIEQQIESLGLIIGSNEPEFETGLHAEYEVARRKHTTAKGELRKAEQSLEKKLTTKAIDRQVGIKYNSGKYGDINYTKSKLERDIDAILSNTYKPLDAHTKAGLEALLLEQPKQVIQESKPLGFLMSFLVEKTKTLVERRITVSDKIEELIRDVALNRWVKEGCELHKGKRTVCALCGSVIKDERWDQLLRHFDEESEQLEEDITLLIADIRSHQESIKGACTVDRDRFYLKFYSEIDSLKMELSAVSSKYNAQLDLLIRQLETRLEVLTSPLEFADPHDYSNEIQTVMEKYQTLRKSSNEYTTQLTREQEEARNMLRLQEVADFVSLIGYCDAKEEIQRLKDVAGKTQQDEAAIFSELQRKKSLKQELLDRLSDESKGAEKVNHYLRSFFGNDYISLEPVKANENQNKQVRFEIVRDGKKAYHLSEGECSLVALCYFIAKLDDAVTKGKNPIIWIDDPISSLDSNHVFFVYSLIKSEIVDTGAFSQLFISTHSLEFLKYLTSLNRKPGGFQKGYFFICREGTSSSLKVLPNYLKEFATEYNYLFQKVYECSINGTADDTNYLTYYNFANNARKFLELHLFFKYPDNTDYDEKMEKFFGENAIPAILMNRMSNEYSHLKQLERAALPVNVPEIHLAAKTIVDKLIENDEEQYKALMTSIGMTEDILQSAVTK